MGERRAGFEFGYGDGDGDGDGGFGIAGCEGVTSLEGMRREAGGRCERASRLGTVGVGVVVSGGCSAVRSGMRITRWAGI